MEEIADWLRRGYKASEAECDGHELPASPHGITLPEHIAAEQYALNHGLWFDDDSKLGEMGPSGDENYCYMGYARSVFPIFSQYYVQNAENASLDEIANYMGRLGFFLITISSCP